MVTVHKINQLNSIQNQFNINSIQFKMEHDDIIEQQFDDNEEPMDSFYDEEEESSLNRWSSKMQRLRDQRLRDIISNQQNYGYNNRDVIEKEKRQSFNNQLQPLTRQCKQLMIDRIEMDFFKKFSSDLKGVFTLSAYEIEHFMQNYKHADEIYDVITRDNI